MALTLATAGLLGGLALGGKLVGYGNQYGTNAQEQAYKLEQIKQQYEYDSQLKAQQYGYDQALNQQNYELERQKRATEYQDTVKSMEEAGLNPALAYSGGLTSVGGGTPQEQPTNAKDNQKTNLKELINTAFLEAYLKGATEKIEKYAKSNNIKGIKKSLNTAYKLL